MRSIHFLVLLALVGCEKTMIDDRAVCAFVPRACFDGTEFETADTAVDTACEPEDKDGDGAFAPSVCDRNGDDCDDDDSLIFPDAVDDPGNGVDENCDGKDEEIVLPVDADEDGVTADLDCDDADDTVYPGAEEICDDQDNDCDALIDYADVDLVGTIPIHPDTDEDGYGTSDMAPAVCPDEIPPGYSADGTDCNDANPDVHPGADEWDCMDLTDYNCDGQTGFTDDDGDGHPACDDCDDSRMEVFPGAEELCDTLDNDCNGITDDADTVTDAATFYADVDGDGYGNASVTVQACTPPSGYVADATDCDDAKALIRPGGQEVCDAQSVDEDCDGAVNDADPSATGQLAWYADTDRDGYGTGAASLSCVGPNGAVNVPGDCKDTDTAYHPGAPETSCADPNDYNCDGQTGFADLDGDGSPACQDCNDSNPNIRPGATEVCDGLSADEDCDGAANDADISATGKSTWYADADGDGFGKASATVQACAKPSGYVATAGDCDDTKTGVNPSALEVCDSNVDNDCDSLADDADPTVSGRSTFYRDADTDGYGDPLVTKLGCVQPGGYVSNSQDCKDAAAAINPAAAETCDTKDNDCDGLTDDADTGVTGRPTWYADADTDSYGNAGGTKQSCSQPSGYVAVSTDCDDTKNAIHPGALEVCNVTDDDCDSLVDEGVTTTYYPDADNDTYGKSTGSVQACSTPAGYRAVAGDCDDTKAAINPAATEVCDGVDNNCVAGVDENFTPTTWYPDSDNDSYGKTSSSVLTCSAPAGHVAQGGDCDDTKAAVYPGAAESCNGIDDDCDSVIDDGYVGSQTWYRDADFDTYGTVLDKIVGLACYQPGGYIANGTDCDDSRASVHPTADEICSNGINDDCDGDTDEAPCL